MPVGINHSPAQLGAALSVSDSTALAQLDATGLTIGTSVYNIAVKNSFVLTLSTDDLSPDNVIAVNGVAGVRWIKNQSAAPPWLDQTQFYASPAGKNTNTGIGWTEAFADIYTAIQAAKSAGGGIVNFTSNTPAGGPIQDQGIWLRQDGNEVPGFINIAGLPLILRGWSNSPQSSFGDPGPATFLGPNNDAGREKPAFWCVGGAQSGNFVVENLRTPNYLYCPGRTWDYHRNADKSIKRISITNSSRSSGQTTHTLTLPAPYAVAKAARDGSNTVSLYLDWPMGYQYAPQNCYIRVTSTDARFPSIDVLAASVFDGTVRPGQDGIVITYTQAGSAVSVTDVTGVTVTSHCLAQSDRLELASTSSEFPTSQYVVTTATVNTVTVTDIYGYAPRSATVTVANIGTLTKQQRSRLTCNSWLFRGVAMVPANLGGNAPTDDFLTGPTFDMTGEPGFPSRFVNCAIYGQHWGGAGVNLAHVDQDRCFGILQDAGASYGDDLIGLTIEDCVGFTAGVRFYGNSNIMAVYVNGFVADTPTGFNLPTVDLFDRFSVASIGGGANISRAVCADGITGIPAGYRCQNAFNGDRADALHVQSDFASLGPSTFHSNVYGLGPNPWVLNQIGTWQRGYAGGWAGLPRAYGTYQSPYQNLVPSTWVADAGLPSTTAPDGTNTAATVTTGANVNLITLPTLNVGDRVFLGVWVNTATDTGAQELAGKQPIYALSYDGGRFQRSGQIYTGPTNMHWGAGWQYVVAYDTVAVGSANTQVSLRAGSDAVTKFWMPTAYVIPASVPDNDAFEAMGTARQQPGYLVPGSAGTNVDIKLIGHGGLGTAKKYTAGAGSGQITVGSSNGKYVELFDESGNSLGVFGPGNAFTVNP